MKLWGRGPLHPHYGHFYLVGALTICAASAPFDLPGWAFWYVFVPLFLGIHLGSRADIKHSEAPCERCVENMPLDPDRKANSRLPLLRAAHLFSGPRGYIATQLAQSALMILLAVFVTLKWRSGITAAIELYVFMELGPIVAFRAHGQYAPWCPWCRGGGTDAMTPDPRSNLPVPSAS